MDLDKFNFPRYLVTLPLFSNMRPEDLTRLATGCTLRRMDRGKLIFRAGGPCNEFHATVLGVDGAGRIEILENAFAA